MRPKQKETNQNPKQEAQKNKQAKQRAKPKPKAKEARRRDPKKQARKSFKQQQPNSRHTTHPPGPCLGRSLVIPNVRKARA
jgi:hypothetical protein